MEYLFTFIEGFASFISPCILPMIPIYISYFAGKDDNNSSKKIVNAVGFVIGFTIVFILLSIFASTFGKFVGEYSKYIKILFGTLVIILGLNYIGIFKIKFLNRTNQVKANAKDLNFIKSILFGIMFSISWTPCIGTFLSSALMLVANEKNLLKGIVLILLYSIGLGISFVISVVLIDKLKSAFNFIKKNYHVVIKISGVVLILMGIYILFS
ncbi:MAG: cytochrome c biogenesis protein CcdA [Clostridia bacterium]|nr:cytochrome c biogenesis protein CcdA [Clostridia bacterium]